MIENKTVLLTGGAGFVGSYVAEMVLEHQPKRVFLLDNLLRGSMRNIAGMKEHRAVDFVEGDIRDTDLLRRLVAEADLVFHLAALRINRCAADPDAAFDVMGRATHELIKACVELEIEKLVYSSSASVYGLATHFPTPESDPPYDNRTLYGAYKTLGEQLLRSYHHAHGLDYVALRYFNIYGPRMDTEGKYTEVMIKWLDCIRDGVAPKIFGDGSTSMDFVHVRDVARANVLAMQSDATDVALNIGCQVETSLRELLAALLAANRSELQPTYHEESTVNPVSRRLADISLAAHTIGFEPTIDLETGLAELSRWYFSLQAAGEQVDP